ncbi:hypothetical protein GCM10007989_02870 [Devosia pacifica]|uniref:Endolytic peptidoglycan transglycosylase RlpA n=1 Tax=Devosia pacifica TaxID=1335967 RepID=A0A918RT88_9HYPH|nr:septal ring lytic transglycosylase RlpA family protein [Devosia pacifica]GHA11931.1 hypothetical protein GCM10007989_02870 [Devosia pacifica]
MTARCRTSLNLVFVSALLAPMLAACGGTLGPTVSRAAFTSKEFGVPVSERVTWNANPRKGGGRYLVGQPYSVRGQMYYPAENPNYRASGHASWYGADFHGRRTANGEIFSANALTAAHPTLPLPSYVRVTNRENGRSIIVRVNDRGPYIAGRVIDLSSRAATMLGYVQAGSTEVDVEYVGRAPLEGDDTKRLLASYSGPAVRDSGTRVASAGDHTVVGMASNLIGGLFGYAETPQQQPNTGALAAVTSLAEGGVSDLPTSGTAQVDIALGQFSDTAAVEYVADAFAMLGAVEETPAASGTMLSLSALKPGVGMEDVSNLAAELGLSGVSLY